MFFKKNLASAAVTALLTVSTAAAAAPANHAASLSLSRASDVRAGSKVDGANHISSTVINVGILAALVVIVLVATSSGDDDDSGAPSSP